MLDANTDYGRLWATVNHLLALDIDADTFIEWFGDRGDDVIASLEAFPKAGEVADFINMYAGSLADRLWGMVSAGKATAALEAAPAFLQELANQARRFAESAVSERATPAVSEPMLPEIVYVTRDWDLLAA